MPEEPKPIWETGHLKGVAFDGKEAKSQDTVFVKLYVRFREVLVSLKGAPLSVFICIALHMNFDDCAYPGQRTIAKETGYALNTIQKAIDLLILMGYIEVTTRMGRAGSYYKVKLWATTRPELKNVSTTKTFSGNEQDRILLNSPKECIKLPKECISNNNTEVDIEEDTTKEDTTKQIILSELSVPDGTCESVATQTKLPLGDDKSDNEGFVQFTKKEEKKRGRLPKPIGELKNPGSTLWERATGRKPMPAARELLEPIYRQLGQEKYQQLVSHFVANRSIWGTNIVDFQTWVNNGAPIGPRDNPRYLSKETIVPRKKIKKIVKLVGAYADKDEYVEMEVYEDEQ